MTESRIIVALDNLSEQRAMEIIRVLQAEVYGFKANDLLDKMGLRDCIYSIRQYGRVMADPKLCDIPNTVANRIKVYFGAIEDSDGYTEIEEAYQADIVTVMASAGLPALQRAVQKKKEFEVSTKIAAVTVLTSFDEEECNLTLGGPVKAKVLQYARNAALAGCDAIVCSAQELLFLKQYPELNDLMRITPGIRPKGASADDQKRINTPEEAVKNGADQLVIGRAITESEDPLKAVQSINKSIEDLDM
ncbi:MAG: orotidine-5'-phosphate decarboxylase [Candidatus Omnitrophica bacterium]|nr:orotidine-5'-phosphate decarboxylase [Candidatus Omnitrophota bacterium]